MHKRFMAAALAMTLTSAGQQALAGASEQKPIDGRVDTAPIGDKAPTDPADPRIRNGDGFYRFTVPKTVADQFRNTDKNIKKFNINQLHDLAMALVDECAAGNNVNKSMACIGGWTTLLANYHQGRAIDQNASGLGEKTLTVVGVTGLLLGGASRGVITSNVWSTIAIGPLVWAQAYGTQPREELQYGAAMSFRRLSEHYDEIQRTLEILENPSNADNNPIATIRVNSSSTTPNVPKSEFDPGAYDPTPPSPSDTAVSSANVIHIDGDCAALAVQSQKVTAADAVKTAEKKATASAGEALEILQPEIKEASTYCQAYSDAEQAFAAYRNDIAASLRALPKHYIIDVHKLEGVFRKVDRTFEASPSDTLSDILASPFQTIATAIHSGSKAGLASDPSISFDLEKDGLALENPLVPNLSAPTKTFPTNVLAPDSNRQKNVTAAASKIIGGDGSKALAKTLDNIQKFSSGMQGTGILLNQAEKRIAWISTSYKMTFDFRQSKATSEIVASSGATDTSAKTSN